MRRQECNCHSQFFTLASVYRFWKCTSDIPLDDLGQGDSIVPPSGPGKRDFWYPNSRIHKDFESAVATDPAMEVFGLQFGEGNTCEFFDSDDFLTLSRGRLPNEPQICRRHLDCRTLPSANSADVGRHRSGSWQGGSKAAPRKDENIAQQHRLRHECQESKVRHDEHRNP